MILVTDIGHDPDDVIALSYLIENNIIPTDILVYPGYSLQLNLTYSILKLYGVDSRIASTTNKKSEKYNPGKHTSLLLFSYNQTYKISEYNTDKVLIIGPAKNLGNKIKCEELFFQGGYSPNSILPLEKFKGIKQVQSFNPCSAKEDFLALRDSSSINNRYYIGKNVCHGYTRENLSKVWSPSNEKIKEFYINLNLNKAMHDVLAAQCFINKNIGIWSQESPKFILNQMTTEYTNKNIWSLIGLNNYV